MVPEPEPIDAGRALGHGKKRLAVVPLHPCHQQVAAVQLDGTSVEHRVHPQPLHQVRVRLRVEVVAPDERRVVGRKDRVLVALHDAVVTRHRLIGALQEGLIRLPKGLKTPVEGLSIRLRICVESNHTHT